METPEARRERLDEAKRKREERKQLANEKPTPVPKPTVTKPDQDVFPDASNACVMQPPPRPLEGEKKNSFHIRCLTIDTCTGCKNATHLKNCVRLCFWVHLLTTFR